jgi:hypothetical protein
LTHYPGDSESYRSARVGEPRFGEGCMTGIRNLPTHDTDELEEQIAFEHLAALSVHARWAEEAEVVTDG